MKIYYRGFNLFKNVSHFYKSPTKGFSTQIQNSLVKIKYSELVNPENKSTFLFEAISKAYNKDGLGIMVIEDVPNVLETKRKLFDLNHKLINLPESELKEIEKPELNYSFGWSYGKEYLSSKPDLLKASFYATLRALNNPNKFPNYNVWPESIPYLKPTLNSLGEIIRNVGLIILKNIDLYIKSNFNSYNLNYPEIISDSVENTARLLYYFPRNKFNQMNLESNSDSQMYENESTNWCEWHNDHGSLTGLVSADYLYPDGSIAKNLNLTKTGLYVQNRKGDIIKMAHGPNDLAFQVGETLQIHSGGLLHATPHAVKFMDDVPDNVARSTLALFMEPNKDFKLYLPKEATVENIKTHSIYKYIPKLEERYKENMDFGEFCKNTIKLYYLNK